MINAEEESGHPQRVKSVIFNRRRIAKHKAGATTRNEQGISPFTFLSKLCGENTEGNQGLLFGQQENDLNAVPTEDLEQPMMIFTEMNVDKHDFDVKEKRIISKFTGTSTTHKKKSVNH